MLSALDTSIVLIYLTVVTVVGLRAGRGKNNQEELFVGGRRIPSWAVLGSLIATEVSAATFLAVPGVGFSENFNYLQFGLGSIAARFFVAYVFITIFYQNGCMTIYQFLAQRFGERSQKIGSILFLVTRLMASGVRLLIAASGISIILGIPISFSIPAFCILAFIYTGIGGIKAVIWTDCIQAGVFIIAGVSVMLFLGNTLGWQEIFDTASNAGRLEIFRFSPQEDSWQAWFQDSNMLWLAVLFGFVQTTASMGTDQDLTQRLLAAKSSKEARRSLILSGFLGIPIAALFLTIGASLFVLAESGQANVLVGLERSDEAFPRFIADLAPAGLKGILIAGVLAAAMSSLDSAMAALSSSAIKDLIEPIKTRFGAVSSIETITRSITAVFAVFLGVIAMLLHQTEGQFLWLAFQLSSLTYGALLGLFLLGLTNSKRGNDTGNTVAVVFSVSLTLSLLILIKMGHLNLAWAWLIVIGSMSCFAVAYLFKGAKEINS